MLEVLQQDFIRNARAKGLAASRVIEMHALCNALLPVVTMIGVSTGHLLSSRVCCSRVDWKFTTILFINIQRFMGASLIESCS